MKPTTPLINPTEQDKATRRARAQKLCDAMDEEAGSGRVLSGMWKVWIFCQANDKASGEDRYCREGTDELRKAM